MLPKLSSLVFLISIGFCFAGGESAVSADENHALQVLEKIVSINTHGTNTEGLREVGKILTAEFEALGYSTQKHTVGNTHQVLSFGYPNSKPSVLMVGHIDTVFLKTDKFQSLSKNGEKWTGPGVIDMKGGLAVMLDLLAKLSPEERAKTRIVINDDEEVGSSSSKDKIQELAKGIPYALVFEPGLPDGAVVTSSSGVRWMKMKVHGKAAHAGLEHAKGVNACTELAAKILKMSELTDYSRKLTLNIGVIEGGSQANVVCENASVRIDIRYTSEKDIAQTLAKLEKIAHLQFGPSSPSGVKPTGEIELVAGLAHMPETQSTELLQLTQRAASGMHENIRGVHVGYASDANHLAGAGVKVLAGLGPYGGGMHTANEFMELGSFHKRVALGLALVREVFAVADSGRVASR